MREPPPKWRGLFCVLGLGQFYGVIGRSEKMPMRPIGERFSVSECDGTIGVIATLVKPTGEGVRFVHLIGTYVAVVPNASVNAISFH
jgi:hypothetical protein